MKSITITTISNFCNCFFYFYLLREKDMDLDYTNTYCDNYEINARTGKVHYFEYYVSTPGSTDRELLLIEHVCSWHTSLGTCSDVGEFMLDDNIGVVAQILKSYYSYSTNGEYTYDMLRMEKYDRYQHHCINNTKICFITTILKNHYMIDMQIYVDDENII